MCECSCNNDLKNHTDNSVIHVTQTDKDFWNKTIPTLWGFDALGLSEDTATPADIVAAMSDNSMFLAALTTTGYNAGLYPNTWGLLKVTKYTSSFTMFEWQSQSGGGSAGKNQTRGTKFIGYYNGGASEGDYWTGWLEVADASKFVSLGGDTMSGNLNISRVWPEVNLIKSDIGCVGGVLTGTNNVILEIDNDGTGKNYRRLVLFNSTAQSNKALCLQLHDTVDGTTAVYNLYGDHLPHDHSTQALTPKCIELMGNNSSGGYIDFHYASSTADYTSRIVGWASNTLEFISTGGLMCQGLLRPSANGSYTLGHSSYRWGQIYSTASSISTSDRNLKNSIEALDDKAVDFILSIPTVSYKFNDGTSDRRHWGMISQDIEELMNTLEIDSKDFAGFIKSPKEIWEKETGIWSYVLDENGEQTYEYSLRYEEFIAPLIKTVQYQQSQINELKEEIEKIKNLITY